MEIPDGSGYIPAMDKKPKRPRDLNQLAKKIVDEATEPRETKKREPLNEAPADRPPKGYKPGSSIGLTLRK